MKNWYVSLLKNFFGINWCANCHCMFLSKVLMGWHAIFFIFWGFHAQMLMLQEIGFLNNAAVSELMRGL